MDDTPSLTPMMLRAKCRRIKARHGLDLVMIDYMQLMEASGGARGIDNRQQEISYISRSLKGLARELGVPVIALRGDRHVARVSASILTHALLPELVAENPDECVSLASGLARDRDRLDAYHANLRERVAGSPLCDESSFARRIESAFRDMWQRHVERQPGRMAD